MAFETLASGYGLIEGPRVDEPNRLYFSDVQNGGVYRRSPNGSLEFEALSDQTPIPGSLFRVDPNGTASKL